MKKSEAVALINKKYGMNLKMSDYRFSNVNKAAPVWWFDIPLKQLEMHSIVNLILADGDTAQLMQIPTNFLKENLHGLKIRKDKDMFSLEIDTLSFKNVVGTSRLNLEQFLR